MTTSHPNKTRIKKKKTEENYLHSYKCPQHCLYFNVLAIVIIPVNSDQQTPEERQSG